MFGVLIVWTRKPGDVKDGYLVACNKQTKGKLSAAFRQYAAREYRSLGDDKYVGEEPRWTNRTIQQKSGYAV